MAMQLWPVGRTTRHTGRHLRRPGHCRTSGRQNKPVGSLRRPRAFWQYYVLSGFEPPFEEAPPILSPANRPATIAGAVVFLTDIDQTALAEAQAQFHKQEGKDMVWTVAGHVAKEKSVPAEVAEGLYFLAGPASPKSTGNILNIDADNAISSTR